MLGYSFQNKFDILNELQSDLKRYVLIHRCVVIDCFKSQNIFIGNSFSSSLGWVHIKSLLRFALRYLALPLRNVIESYPDRTYTSKDLRAQAVDFGKSLYGQVSGSFRVEA